MTQLPRNTAEAYVRGLQSAFADDTPIEKETPTKDHPIVQQYLRARMSAAGKAGTGDSKRKGANASWTVSARAKRASNIALKHGAT